jgi:uncharacterized membrane protein YphA (DoxX/SURF4 family)
MLSPEEIFHTIIDTLKTRNSSEMRIAVIIARIITGAAFLFSGTVKAIDPLGSAYKFQDYFNAFNIGFLSDLSLPLAVLLCTVEFITGFCILTGIRIKAGINMLMLLMLIFTPLTLVLALTNPVSDCGCFGDAIKLTNWETFWKNVVLMIFALILFLQRKNINEKSSPWQGPGHIKRNNPCLHTVLIL